MPIADPTASLLAMDHRVSKLETKLSATENPPKEPEPESEPEPTVTLSVENKSALASFWED